MLKYISITQLCEKSHWHQSSNSQIVTCPQRATAKPTAAHELKKKNPWNVV